AGRRGEHHDPDVAGGLEPDVSVRVLVACLANGTGQGRLLAAVVAAPAVMSRGGRGEGQKRGGDQHASRHCILPARHGAGSRPATVKVPLPCGVRITISAMAGLTPTKAMTLAPWVTRIRLPPERCSPARARKARVCSACRVRSAKSEL